MCTRVTCRKCGRPSWVGCGAHVEQVLGDVPREMRCQCKERAAADRAARKSASGGSWLQKLFGR